MKLNTATVLVDLEELPVLDAYQVEEDGKRVQKERPLTLGSALAGALVTGVKDGENTPVQISEMYKLALKMKKDAEVILTAELVVLCKDAVAKTYQPLISGQVILLLEG